MGITMTQLAKITRRLSLCGLDAERYTSVVSLVVNGSPILTEREKTALQEVLVALAVGPKRKQRTVNETPLDAASESPGE